MQGITLILSGSMWPVIMSLCSSINLHSCFALLVFKLIHIMMQIYQQYYKAKAQFQVSVCEFLSYLFK